MARRTMSGWLAVGLLLALTVSGVAADKAPSTTEAQGLAKQGNWKDAYEVAAKLALDPEVTVEDAVTNLDLAFACLNNLGRINETDDFVEKAVAAQAKKWQVVARGASLYLDNMQHYGAIIAGKFERGPHRGGAAKFVNSYERDRVRALQLMQQAMGVIRAGDAKGGEVGNFYFQLASALLGNRGWSEAWRLQYLTDLATLPDYEEGGYYGRWGHRGASSHGAPVNADGTPVFYHMPKSWSEAQNDGERWRWALTQAAEYTPDGQGRVLRMFAEFLQNQFSVRTMASYGYGRRGGEDTKKDEAGPYAVQTLGEDETIARLATGIKRFKLPDEFNYIKIYQQLAAAGKLGDQPLNALAQIFEDRRQYDKAADYWRRSIKLGDHNNWKQKRLDQIVGNWGQFEQAESQPAGRGAAADFRFRNGNKVTFTAWQINERKLLDDLKAYLKSAPKQLNWEQVQISNLGWRLVTRNQRQYVGAKAAEWSLDLAPPADHFDRRITVATPLQKAGAYLVTAQMADGNTSNIVLWVADTVIVQKPMANKPWFYVADAVSGKPVAKATIDFFGYYQEWVNDKATRGGRHIVHTAEFAELTDDQGQVRPRQAEGRYQWLVTAATPEGRLAYLGFTGLWTGRYHDAEYNQTKVFAVTDRPVYRPEQTVKFKFWINQAQYDREGKSPYAGEKFTVRIHDAKGEQAFEKKYVADEYGGLDGEFALAKGAALGVYQMQVLRPDNNVIGGGSFRVEEYKKPEFEVKVEAPKEPVMLGDKITARIEAKYYFGAPVAEGKVKYKVMRTQTAAEWYPPMLWDWLYGPGYWWFAQDYAWYPHWDEWGMRAPWPWWWHRPQPQPELVAEVEKPIGADGTISVEIDTAVAKALFGDEDQSYQITAEVTDASRRTIVGQGSVLAASKPFKVYAWVDCGHYRVGDAINAGFCARTPDGKPVQGKGEIKLLKVASYDKNGLPVETPVQTWPLDTNEEGRATQQIKASQAGQYRLSYTVTDAKGHAIEGGYVFCVTGEGFDSSRFRFNDLELVPDRKQYRPGEKIELMVNTNRADSWVLLFLRPANGCYLAPKLLHLEGKSVNEQVEVMKKDMPNFFLEALTVADGRVYTQAREIAVPPEDRVLKVDVKPSAERYKPGEKATVDVTLTEANGEPFVGSTVISIYDKAVEYISGGSNVADIKEFFWKWRRHHNPRTQSSLDRRESNVVAPKQLTMQFLGAFGRLVERDEEGAGGGLRQGGEMQVDRLAFGNAMRERKSAEAAAPMAAMAMDAAPMAKGEAGFDKAGAGGVGGGEGPLVEPTVRTQFADTAFWAAAVATNANGKAQVSLTMPENLSTWKARVWALGGGARCGEGSVEVVTTKNLIIRLQAPRFFVQKDEVVLSANVHNYLKTAKQARVVLELAGGTLASMGAPLTQTVSIEPNGEKRVDWRVKVVQPGEAKITMKALTDEESDAMQMTFPVLVHGMLKTESFSGSIRPEQTAAKITINVPAERRPEQSRLEIRYSPTLAGAMIDALPYLIDYPYDSTDQTVSRFLPAVLTQRTLQRMGVNLRDIERTRTNLNAQEIGDAAERAKQWKRFDVNPVFDPDKLKDVVSACIERLASMQCGDGGWGWFSGWGERSYPHTTALVVRGLQVARDNDVAIIPGMLERGAAWLQRCQDEQLTLRRNADNPDKEKLKLRWKASVDNMDALVYMVLVDGKLDNPAMRDYLYKDRNNLAVYAKGMVALACNKLGDAEKRDMLIRNIEQFLEQDDENQTAWLRLPQNNWWWCWYGSEFEAEAYYLKLLAATDPKSEKAPRLVKYLLNNRKHATYWNSTRDTAMVVEAFADYIKASGEDRPDMTLTIVIDGKSAKQVKINKDNLFTFDNKLVLEGDAVTTGAHTIEFRKEGVGPLYFNAYLTNFTLEDPITAAGLEIKVARKYYKLTRIDKSVKVAGARGQALDQKVEKHERTELPNLAMVKSGDLVEVELKLTSKNDYEYILFEDMKPAGFEPVEVRSGYSKDAPGAYVEFRDERVAFFMHGLARGDHSVSYRMRAEIPGRFSALPTKGSGVYAPELKANSDEIKLHVED